jgi:hypothetical protein
MSIATRSSILLTAVLQISCATGPSGEIFDSPIGQWTERFEMVNGSTSTAQLHIVDQNHATYTSPHPGRIEFYAVDEQGLWKGYWINETGRYTCAEEKNGSRFWGESIYQFNETFNRYTGSWDACGEGHKYAVNGYR